MRARKKCARNLGILLAQELEDKTKTELVKEYPHLMTASTSVAALLRESSKAHTRTSPVR